MKHIKKSAKLNNVCYDIRGPVLQKAKQMEEEGHKIIKLNIGNIAAFGIEPPDEIVQDMIRNLPSQVAAGYTDSKGLFAPRKAVVHYCQQKNIPNVTIDDVYLGNGASELIVMSMNALLNSGDEVLVPAPDYPLWTAAVSLSGGKPVGFKLCIGHPWEWFAMVKAMLETGITPDFIVVDGAEGGTGAAPLEFTDHVGAPVQEGLLLVHNTLRGAGLRERIKIGVAGKVVSAFDVARLMALGADWCNSARGFMFALGCIQAQHCHTGACPTGVATQSAWLMRGLDPTLKAARLAKLLKIIDDNIAQPTLSVVKVARLLGDTVKTVERTYGHHSIEFLMEDVA